MRMFPSPLGVHYISMTSNKIITKKTITFPSPIGVHYISIKFTGLILKRCKCFRPLLGFIIFQCVKQ